MAKSKKASVNALGSTIGSNSKIALDFAKRELSGALKARSIDGLSEQQIIVHTENGVVVHGAILNEGNVTKGELNGGSVAVSYLINTIKMTEPVSGITIEPGALLVEMRELSSREFAFDLIAGDGEKKASVRGMPSHSGAFENAGDDRALFPIDIDVSVENDLDAPLPAKKICISVNGVDFCFSVPIVLETPS